jgi:hypothetical protein
MGIWVTGLLLLCVSFHIPSTDGAHIGWSNGGLCSMLIDAACFLVRSYVDKTMPR